MSTDDNSNTYPMDIKGLSPLKFDINENGLSDIKKGDNLDMNHVVEAREHHSRRKKLKEVHPNLVSAKDVFKSKERKHKLENAHFDGHTPAWAMQLKRTMEEMTTKLANVETNQEEMQNEIKQKLEELKTKQNDMQKELTTTQKEMMNKITGVENKVEALQQSQKQILITDQQDSHRKINKANAQTMQSLILPLCRDDGKFPKEEGTWFPANVHALQDATSPNQLHPLLAFYGLETGGHCAHLCAQPFTKSA